LRQFQAHCAAKQYTTSSGKVPYKAAQGQPEEAGATQVTKKLLSVAFGMRDD
jgi:hypothetical protein